MPDGEVIVATDTDLPVPAVVSRLRIDIYTQDGQWLATRDDVRPDRRDWPTSFSLYHDDPSNEGVALVRLRAYPEGRLIRYTGIVYAAYQELLHGAPVGNGQPRLVIDGQDRTPEFEPDPLVTIDRVVRVRLSYGKVGRIQVLLTGDCAGRMPQLSTWTEARSCIDASRELWPIDDEPVEPATGALNDSRAGTWGLSPCPAGSDTSSPRVCIPGGGFILGDAFFLGSDGLGGALPLHPRPERIVRISRFELERDEVSVGQYRSALAAGLVPPVAVGVYEKDGPPGADPSYSCTFSASPRDREGYPLSCVSWSTARAYCRFMAGDLPTEAQFEYAAVAAGGLSKTSYPWGEQPPDCSRAVYARSYAYADCLAQGAGVQPLQSGLAELHPLGLHNLVGSLREHVLDTLAPYTDACWTSAPVIDPACLLAPREG